VIRIADATRSDIDVFMRREWEAENADRFVEAAAPVGWDWREYCLAAYDADEIVGTAIFRVRGGVAHLKNVISSRLRRSQGIGGALLDEFVRRTREMGCHKLTLVTYHDDQSMRFYQRHGFVVEAILRNDAHHVDRCQMVLFSDPAPNRV
jgi:GNAT superfamily N-acetyltransferase